MLVMRKRGLFIIGGVVVLLLLAVAVIVIILVARHQSEEYSSTNRTVAQYCTEDMMRQSIRFFGPNDLDVGLLPELISEIRQVYDYQNDANCQFMLFHYAIADDNDSLAAKALGRLMELSRGGRVALSDIFGEYVIIEDLEFAYSTRHDPELDQDGDLYGGEHGG